MLAELVLLRCAGLEIGEARGDPAIGVARAAELEAVNDRLRQPIERIEDICVVTA
jgi:hypothetical protein